MSVCNRPNQNGVIYSSSVISIGAAAGAGGAGGNGSYSASWITPNTQFSNAAGETIMTITKQDKNVIIEDEATLEVKGNIRINGQDLEERLNRIETLLHIPTRDVTIEERHPKLRMLFEEYMKELEKYRTWDRLKGTTS